ncbi:hypothetical protein SCA6_004348 [Theobroma cacao]
MNSANGCVVDSTLRSPIKVDREMKGWGQKVPMVGGNGDRSSRFRPQLKEMGDGQFFGPPDGTNKIPIFKQVFGYCHEQVVRKQCCHQKARGEDPCTPLTLNPIDIISTTKAWAIVQPELRAFRRVVHADAAVVEVISETFGYGALRVFRR